MSETKRRAAPGVVGQLVQTRNGVGFLFRNTLTTVNDFGVVCVETYL